MSSMTRNVSISLTNLPFGDHLQYQTPDLVSVVHEHLDGLAGEGLLGAGVVRSPANLLARAIARVVINTLVQLVSHRLVKQRRQSSRRQHHCGREVAL